MPDGTAQRREPTYYTILPGTFERVSELLTAYSAENFTPTMTITTDFITDMVRFQERVKFSSGEIYYSVLTENTGLFTNEWQLDTWEAKHLYNHVFTGNAIQIHSGIPGVDLIAVVIYTDTLLAVVESQGLSAVYSFGEATAAVIERQFAEFQAIAEPLG